MFHRIERLLIRGGDEFFGFCLGLVLACVELVGTRRRFLEVRSLANNSLTILGRDPCHRLIVERKEHAYFPTV